ncbi:hypothetical protein EUX98_g8268 [Antrodiella citrinella]|uniref:RanBD1 domain-containing protein n=1 Tax=Antrodiella citrinella TaxID=2447956 RepID=A0A4S4MAW5_9APHY|nr:hypothetical protein EUX98_g8268 [Antrodiella citrinella]
MASPPPTLPKEPEEIALDADEQPEETEVQAGEMEEEQCDSPGETGLATPPLDMDVETRVSRKREREVSLEPSTPQATSVEIDAPASAHRDRDRRTPAKKNRTSAQLDSTAEQDEDGQEPLIPDDSEPAPRSTPPSRSGSSRTPPLDKGDAATALAAEVSASPPHETKVRLISRGVKDLTWKSLGDASTKLAFGSSAKENPDESEMDHEDEVPSEDTAIIMREVPQGSNSPVVDAAAEAEEHSGAADPIEAPASSETSLLRPEAVSRNRSPVPSPIVVAEPLNPSPPPSPPSTGSPVVAPLLPSALEDDVKSGQKRKLGDRSVSERHIPGDIGERKGKRASPPPTVEEVDEPAEKPDVAKPKPSGFMAYASSSSPFAGVKGPSMFSSAGSSTLSRSKAAWSPSTSTVTGANQSPPMISSPFSFTPSTSPSKPRPSSVTSTPTSTTSSMAFPMAFEPVVLATPLARAPQKRTGFEAFASASSPFASAAKRPKSPPPAFASTSTSVHGHSGVGLGFGFGHLGKNGKRSGSPARSSVFGNGASSSTASAFSAYAAAGSPFRSTFGATPNSASSSGSSVLGSALDPPARQGSPLNGGTRTNIFGGGDSPDNKDEGEGEGEGESSAVSFGDRLRAGKDAEEDDDDEATGGGKLDLTEQEVMTGEEDEVTVFQARGKLFTLSDQNQWKEKGTGNFKLNVRRLDTSGARLVMRKEAVYTLLLNAPLFKGMKCSLAQDPRYLRFSVFEGGSTTHYNLRVPSAKIAEELLDEIESHIPTD